jgi:hypothetical protein
MGRSPGVIVNRADMSETRLQATTTIQEAIFDLLLPNFKVDAETKKKLCNFIGTYLHKRPTEPVIDTYANQALKNRGLRFAIAYQTLWLRRNTEFMDHLVFNLAVYEPKPIDFGDIASDNKLKAEYVDAWLAWAEHFEAKPVDGPIAVEEVFSLIQTLKSKFGPSQPTQRPAYEKWVFFHKATTCYILLDSALLQALGMTSKGLSLTLTKNSAVRYIAKGTREDLDCIRAAYPSYQVSGTFRVMYVEGLRLLYKDCPVPPVVQEFLDHLDGKLQIQ